MQINNEQVIEWRSTQKPKFLGRAFIQGVIVSEIENRQGHVHFEVDLDKDLSTTNDRVEVIYNIEFGNLPDYRAGDELIACGDFIVDSWSPMGAVVHWLHYNPKVKNKHEDGFIVIHGELAGLNK
ncbi:hypothetical protein DOE51_11830 [Bdellovibrio sp. NC01]|nr:hypothetical protein DOE51_11830 [Bdellovibrio sp. NC01]